jgi:hypothetical protein
MVYPSNLPEREDERVIATQRNLGRGSDTASWQREDSEKAQETQAVWTSVLQVSLSANSEVGATTMCSRYQMLGRAGGHSLRRLISVVV